MRQLNFQELVAAYASHELTVKVPAEFLDKHPDMTDTEEILFTFIQKYLDNRRPAKFVAKHYRQTTEQIETTRDQWTVALQRFIS